MHFVRKQLLQLRNEIHGNFTMKPPTDSRFYSFKSFAHVPTPRSSPQKLFNGDAGLVENNSVNWIATYLGNRSERTVADRVSSPPSIDACGVPQGSAPAPLLDCIQENDLPECLSPRIRL